MQSPKKLSAFQMHILAFITDEAQTLHNICFDINLNSNTKYKPMHVGRALKPLINDDMIWVLNNADDPSSTKYLYKQ